MSSKTKANLITQANEIKDETAKGANTATRIGNMYIDVIDSVTVNGVTSHDTSLGNYTIPDSGIYSFFNNSSINVTLPEAIEREGQRLLLINQTTDKTIPLLGPALYDINSNVIDEIQAKTIIDAYCVDGLWLAINI